MAIDRLNLFGSNYNEDGADSVDPYKDAGRPTGWRGLSCYCIQLPTPTLTPTPTPTAPPDCFNTGGLNTFLIWNLTPSLRFLAYNFDDLIFTPSDVTLDYNEYTVFSYNCVITEEPMGVFTGQPVFIRARVPGIAYYPPDTGWVRVRLSPVLFNSGSPLYSVTTSLPYIIDEQGILLDMSAYIGIGYSGDGILFTINYTCVCEANYTMTIEEANNPNPTITPTPTPSPTITFPPTITPTPTLRAVGWRGKECYCLQSVTSTPTPTPFPTTIGGTCPPAGTKTGNIRCIGTTLQEELHNGICGTYWSDVLSQSNMCCNPVRATGWRCLQSYCATVDCPPYGTRLGSYCNGTDFIVIYADGNCGQFEENYGNNGVCCTPTPTPSPIPTFETGQVSTRFLNYVGNPPIDNIVGSCNLGCISINVFYNNSLPSLWDTVNPTVINTNTPSNGNYADVEVFDNTLGRSVFSRTKFVDNNNFSPIYAQGFPVIGPASSNTVTLPIFIRDDLQNNLSFNYICEEDFSSTIIASVSGSTDFVLTNPTGTYTIKNCCNCEGVDCLTLGNYQTDSLGQPFTGSYYDVSIPALPTVSGRLYRLYIEVFQNGIPYLQHQFYFVPA